MAPPRLTTAATRAATVGSADASSTSLAPFE
jgi:hypothetical protein